MAVSEEVLLDVRVNNNEAIKNIVDLEKANESMKNQLKELKKSYKDGEISSEQFYSSQANLKAEIKAATTGIRQNTKELATNAASVASADTSINGMRARVGQLTTAWNSLSAEARESDVGKAIGAEMASLNESINTTSLSVNNFKDNIGNYPQAMSAISVENTKVGRTMQSLGISAGTTSKAFGVGMVNSLKAVGKQMLTLMANPLIAGLALIAGVVMTIVAAIKRSDDAMTALQIAFEPITAFIDIVIKSVTAIAEAGAKAFAWIMTLGGSVESEGQKAIKLMDHIEDLRRENIVQEAKDEQALALAKEKANDKENHSIEERKKAIEEVMKIEDEAARRKENIYKKELEQFQKANIHNNKTDEYKDREAELTAQILKAETERANIARSLIRDRNRIASEEAKQAAEALKAIDDKKKANEAAHKEYLKRIEAQKKAEKAAIQAVEDLRLELMADGEEKEIGIKQKANERQIEELKNRLLTEKNLTQKAKDEISEQIKLTEEVLQRDIQIIKDKYIAIELANDESRESKAKELKAQRAATEEKEASEKAALEMERKKADFENELFLIDEFSARATEIKKAQLDAEMAIEIEAAEKSGADILLIEQNYAKMRKDIDKEVINEKLNQTKTLTSSIATLFGENTKAGKAAASATVAIDTFQLASKAVGLAGTHFAAGNIPMGIVAGAQAGVIAASGAKAIKNIWSVKEKGASTVTGVGGTPSAPSGGRAQSVNYVYAQDATNMETAQQIYSNQNDVVVRVTDITEMQNSVKVKESSKI